jgi:hypothetical protein
MALKARYTEQLVVLVDPDTRWRIDQLAEEREVSIGQVTREIIERGLAAEVES